MTRRSFTPTLSTPQANTPVVEPANPYSHPLPMSSDYSTNSRFSGRPRGTVNRFRSSFQGPSGFKIPLVIRRVFRPPTLDFETAIWEIFYLIVSPTKVYKSLYYHKQTKNTWARDDPSFVILLSAFITVSALAWGLAYASGVMGILKLMLYMVLVDFFATGIIIATAGWFLANKFLKQSKRGLMNSIGGEGELEWNYCFDVHCNSFLVIWLCLYVIQFILLPVLTKNNWFSIFLGNTLYLVALCYYFVISFYGYNTMPFLEHTELILLPVPILCILYVISLFGFSMVKTMVHQYFG
ncbi:similar to Saccharomyces cerevisiae YKR030W GMH1 Golgi membrane protein of unknown function [Geotrichum candidum]|uniref:UNC-50 family protein n=2 Tax=Geotrichum candidum TaxID=1173061 RepID=A0A0J9X7S1_GEOCN|nr:similar to Saccharomyces cerevisiae YKR030W GMH1 Golgi membrane protein of unknown function [Geotrichum candidum]